MTRLLLAACLPLSLAAASCAHSFQTAAPAAAGDAGAEPLAVIERLFDGMRANDSAAVRSVFHPDAALMTAAADRDGNPLVRITPIDDFVRAIGGSTSFLDERLHDVEMRVDGGFAQAWTPYHFFVDGEFSHCGVNGFHLARTADGWRIMHIMDTRRREGCERAGG